MLPSLVYCVVSKEGFERACFGSRKRTIKLLKASEDKTIPVILHVFSGGGCVVLEQLEIVLAQSKDAVVTSGCSTGQQTDLLHLYEAIQRGGQVFDSSPADLSLESGLQAIASGVPNKTVRLLIQIVFVIFAIINRIISHVTRQPTGPEQHWTHMLESDIANRQAYIYSTVDRLTNHVKVEQMIAHRRKQRPEAHVMVKRFDDSQHCAHLVKHPKEYQALLDEFLASIKEEKTREKLLEEDPDMTDYQLGMD
jgi:Eukaryotic protein of unknown function (DUF829)